MIDQINDLLRTNQEMNLVVNVAPDEDQLGKLTAQIDADHAKQIEAWKKATKKLKKGQEAPPEPTRAADPADPNKDLVAQRIAAIKELTKGVKMGDVRISFVADPLPAPAAPAAEAPAVVDPKKKGKAAPAPKKPAPAAVAAHPTLVVKIGKVKKLYE